ncbi:GGDEF domain-containing protein [Vibrio hepatarius]|uniref:GGDEF domain-containing protein n=1 Tax=Vibrio hepatarius TaxID=171383 RepID=UPI00142E598D|nr:GGDEF domain-containing protein [Vibrio hepatarius]NIY84676.1 GGDEF domain-containing protein [Vibrio hepatarius]NVJ55004.1 GGDEF domain-containing protein [Vibrionaceae bacterium]
MGVLEQELHELKSQLEQLRLTQRDASFKFTREQKVLKRIIASMTDAYKSENPRLQAGLRELKKAIEQQQDVSSLIPKLAVLERLLKQQGVAMEKQTEHLDSQIKHSGETLLRLAGLPTKIKQDLRDLLSYSNGIKRPNTEQAMKLLGLYERSVKIITANPNTLLNQISNTSDRELLLRLSDQLQNFITELDFEGESGDQLADIRAKLLVGVNTHELLELTLQTLKLVIDGTHYERKTSEQFLEQVNTSLASSMKSSSQNAHQSQSYFEQRQEMNEELSGLITKASSTVKDATELSALRSEVNPLIDQLISVSERLRHAEQREQALIERMNHGKNQLEALFELTQDYRRRLEDQAQRILLDPLTKVHNRTAFSDQLEIEYRRWIRTQHNLRVVLLDIDGFKSINDSFGYTAGDKALKIIARTIKGATNDQDTVARFGGEEFIMILPERSDTDCFQLIQKIQTQVSKLPFKFRDQHLTITLSAASTSFQESDTPEELLERLNRLLKEGKSRGASQLMWK